ncbi:MAG TPA: hypothetical protein VGR16_05185 [Thermomicrobiales bacterium]|nr:hypothetical protein [Thermomicrobiales bacterium]
MPSKMAATASPGIGDPAPDVTLIDGSGAPVHLKDQWEAAPRALALIFLRHFG